jgi:hypothetical protein
MSSMVSSDGRRTGGHSRGDRHLASPPDRTSSPQCGTAFLKLPADVLSSPVVTLEAALAPIPLAQPPPAGASPAA